MIKAWAAKGAKQKLEPFDYDPGPLQADDVEIAVDTCGICHSDISILDNEWGFSSYPAVAGHEVSGRVVALGSAAKGLTIGQRVGVGWGAASCMHCRHCMSGDQNLCAENAATIIGRNGGFAERVRVQWPWAIHIPDGLDAREVGPLLCGGVTVFSPLHHFDIRPTARVGVVGIGGLGHMALKFAAAWGCDVTAFTSTDAKAAEAKGFGAHHVVNSRDVKQIAAIKGKLDLIIVTVNVSLDWMALIEALAPDGRLHVVGVVPEPIPVGAIDLIHRRLSVSGSPSGAPVTMTTMLDFCARHQILPQTEHFPVAKINEALDHLRAGKARYRVVLDM
jgi:uncharacterized zinc-type alcohol dehydrogenase-like protein